MIRVELRGLEDTEDGRPGGVQMESRRVWAWVDREG